MEETVIELRRATINDARMLWRWRNDPATMLASRQAEPLGLDAHKTWLEKFLGKDGQRLFIAEVDGRPVGNGRIEKEYATAWLSWTVAPKHRRNGIGLALAAKVKSEAVRMGYATIGAKVRIGNEASLKIARQLDLNVLWLLP